jgi:hypothetical protein
MRKLPLLARGVRGPNADVEVAEESLDDFGGPVSVFGRVGPLGSPELGYFAVNVLSARAQETEEAGCEEQPVAGPISLGRGGRLVGSPRNVIDQPARPLGDFALPANDASLPAGPGAVGHARLGFLDLGRCPRGRRESARGVFRHRHAVAECVPDRVDPLVVRR